MKAALLFGVTAFACDGQNRHMAKKNGGGNMKFYCRAFSLRMDSAIGSAVPSTGAGARFALKSGGVAASMG